MRTACALVVVAAVIAPATASADAGTQEAMQDYFAGEKRGGLVLVGMGTVGLATGGLLYLEGSDTAKGASYPLLGIGLAHVAAGIFVNLSSRSRMNKFGPQIDKDARGFVATESKRMKGVSTQFLVLKIVEVVLFTGGLTMAVIGNQTDRAQLEGAGYAVAAEMAATFAFDVVAARRAYRYRAKLDVQVTTDPVTGGPIGFLVHRGTF